MTDRSPDDIVPVSVRLGEVVPPEDPEDWTRPLTWVVALGMLAGPVVAAAWFLTSPPTAADRALPGTFAVAALLSAGATAAGATQIGVARAWTTTLGAGLFGALVVVVLGTTFSGDRAFGSASPTMAHALAAAVAGLGGAAVAAIAAALVAPARSGTGRLVAPLLAGIASSAGGVAALMR